MRKIWAIGINTFREAIRNKVLYSLLFFAVAIIFGSLAFGALSVHEEVRLTADLGLAGMSFFLVIIAIFVGVNLVYKELERKTVYVLIPKPVYRFQFVLGKYLGLILTLGVQLVVMGLVLTAVLRTQGATIGAPMGMMLILIGCETLVITAVAVLFSSYSTPFLSGAFTLGLFIVGRSVPEIHAVALKIDFPLARSLLEGISSVIPNLRYFYVTGSGALGDHRSIHGVFVDWAYVASAVGYASLYVILLLLVAIGLFSRRDFV
jgi:ABC-type transport system involved in multi-copper enzyme maturation permease subunit